MATVYQHYFHIDETSLQTRKFCYNRNILNDIMALIRDAQFKTTGEDGKKISTLTKNASKEELLNTRVKSPPYPI